MVWDVHVADDADPLAFNLEGLVSSGVALGDALPSFLRCPLVRGWCVHDLVLPSLLSCLPCVVTDEGAHIVHVVLGE